MKNFITSALIIAALHSFAQKRTFGINNQTLNRKTTAAKYNGSMGEVGAVTNADGLTRIMLCLNSGNENARKADNHNDTTHYRADIKKTDNALMITHPDGTQSKIIDESNLIMVKASGETVAVFHKFSSVNPNHSPANAKYAVSYNNNTAELKKADSLGFKFERKGNVAVITNWDNSYVVMISTGKSAVIVDSRGVSTLLVNDKGLVSLMPSEGFESNIVNEGATSLVNWANGKTQTINNYGPLSLYTSADGNIEAMLNYSKIETNNDNDGGEVTKFAVDKSAIAPAAK